LGSRQQCAVVVVENAVGLVVGHDYYYFVGYYSVVGAQPARYSSSTSYRSFLKRSVAAEPVEAAVVQSLEVEAVGVSGSGFSGTAVEDEGSECEVASLDPEPVVAAELEVGCG